MDKGQAAFELMALFGKLRRATDPQARAAIKQQIDHLVAALGEGGLPDPEGGAPPSEPGRAGIKRS